MAFLLVAAGALITDWPFFTIAATLLGAALAAASRLALEGIDVSVVNARFVKPLDPTILELIEASPWTITIEENALPTGFGSAVLEAVNDARLVSGPILRIGLPDRFVEHGERGELLGELGLDRRHAVLHDLFGAAAVAKLDAELRHRRHERAQVGGHARAADVEDGGQREEQEGAEDEGAGDIEQAPRCRHRTVDDTPYGGGSGMVMRPGPLVDAMEAAEAAELARGGARPIRVLLDPQGERFDQRIARELSAASSLTLVCGRYEGVDERARIRMDRELSIGDFVLMGGEVGAMAIIEAVSRLLPGVLGNPESATDESHAAGPGGRG
jgi:hypothetical protein